MSDEEIALAEAAAQLSAHFVSMMPNPQGGGVIETDTAIRAFDSAESFADALRLHAAEGLEEAEIAAHGLPVSNREREQDAKEQGHGKSKYASKRQKRLAEERKLAEIERKREEARKQLRKEAQVTPDQKRAELLREVARDRVRELRSMAEQASVIDSALSQAATPREDPRLPSAMKPAFDPDRAHRRPMVFGIKA